MSAPFRLIALLVLAALLAACAGTGIRLGAGVEDARRWQLAGKMGIKTNKFAESATINWRQCGELFDVRLSSPLGQTVARIEGRGEQLTVWMEGREPVVTSTPEVLLQEQLGWSVPIRALRYWVRGVGAPPSLAETQGGSPAAQARITGPVGQPDALVQFGWQVRYPAWHQRDTVALPAKIILGDPQLQATLLIREWQLGDSVECSP